ncbi:RICIN domain-containing protein [Streptomyces sp. NPDC005921]
MRLRPLRVLCCSAVLALSAPALLPGTASAAVPTASVYLQNYATGLNAADSGGTVAAHNPKGNEDHQQWTPVAVSGGYQLQNADESGTCLGRSGTAAVTAACGADGTTWTVTAGADGTYTVTVPGTSQYLTAASADSAAVQLGAAGDLARWYLTPVSYATTAMPSADTRTLDQVTFLTAHNAFANGSDGNFASFPVNLFPNQNYDLRRKMRKVGVQLQHIGTQLSWQVFVGDPGRALGLGELVHVVPAPDLTSLKQPVKPAPLAQAHVTYSDNYPIQQTADSKNAPHQDADWVKEDGWDRLWRGEEDEYVVAHFEYSAPPPGPGWKLSTAPGNEIRKVSATTSNGQVAKFLATYEVLDLTSGRFRVNCTNVHFGGGPYVAFTLALVWEPPPPEQDPALQQYLAELAVYEREVAKVQRAAYAQAVHDRLDLISKVRQRDSEDLRKEERHSVFSDLIGQLDLFPGQDAKRHLSAELIRGMFDVDQMLYFVEPDYWRPAPTTGTSGEEHTPPAGAAPAVWPGADSVGRYPVPPHDWEATSGDPVGGATVTSRFSRTGAVNPPRATTSTPQDQLEYRVDYLITENTPPAPTGSSLGWLIQADGDERRNEFLNASWVKAVLPVRPGHELDALGWLSSARVEGDAALDKDYTWQSGDPADWQGKSIGWVLQALAAELQARNTDITRTLAAERVFETGFDPLDGGFRPADPYQIFDQWTEVLPTDQVVAVEVTYDPKTGRQL